VALYTLARHPLKNPLTPSFYKIHFAAPSEVVYSTVALPDYIIILLLIVSIG